MAKGSKQTHNYSSSTTKQRAAGILLKDFRKNCRCPASTACEVTIIEMSVALRMWVAKRRFAQDYAWELNIMNTVYQGFKTR
jgi:hypothetical protein